MKEDAKTIIDKYLKWLNDNDNAETEELKDKKKEAEEELKPVVEKMYSPGTEDPEMPNEMPNEMPPSDKNSGPNVEDVD
jgi:hypothetical protein